MALNVSSAADLISWNGTQDIVITGSFTINSTDAASFPLPNSKTGVVNVSSNKTTGSPYVIIIDAGATAWKGLFTNVSATNSTGMTFSDLAFSFVSGNIQANTGIILGVGTSSGASKNPFGTFTNVSVSIIPSTPSSITYNSPFAGFYPRLLTSSSNSVIVSFTNCIYEGPISTGGGGFIASSNASSTNTSTLRWVSCVAKIRNPPNSTLNPSGGGAFMGTNARAHVISASPPSAKNIVNFLVIGSGNSGVNIGGFFGNNAGSRTVTSFTDSYVFVTDPVNACNLGFIAASWQSNFLFTIQNSYFVTATTSPAQTLTVATSFPGGNLALTNSAFQAGTGSPPGSVALTNTSFDYTYSSSTSTQPFQSWDTSIWTFNPSPQTPPTLSNFKDAPYENYTTAGSLPTLTNLCIFEGTRLLTTNGYVAVENLTYDHILVTADNRTTHIRAILILEDPFMKCYKIPVDFLEKGIPFNDVYLSGGHAIYVSPGVFIHPMHTHPDALEYRPCSEWGKKRHYAIETDDYYNDILVAEGLAVEAFCGNQSGRHEWRCGIGSCARISIGPTE